MATLATIVRILILPQASLEKTLQGQMANPYFPVDMGAMPAVRGFGEITESPLKINDLTVLSRRINHHQCCLSFRIENWAKSEVYETANEPGEASSDRTIRDLARGSGLP